MHPNDAACCRTLILDVAQQIRVTAGLDPSDIEPAVSAARLIAQPLTSASSFSHGGGTLPMLAGRIANFVDRDKKRLPNTRRTAP